MKLGALGAMPIKTRNSARSFALAFFAGAASASPKTEVERLNEQLHEELALDAFARHRANGGANGASFERAGPMASLRAARAAAIPARSGNAEPGLALQLPRRQSRPRPRGRPNVGIYRR